MHYMPQYTYFAVIPVSFRQILHDSFIFLDVIRTKMLPPTTQWNQLKLFYAQY